jgi:hypothetical protein
MTLHNALKSAERRNKSIYWGFFMGAALRLRFLRVYGGTSSPKPPTNGFMRCASAFAERSEAPLRGCD